MTLAHGGVQAQAILLDHEMVGLETAIEEFRRQTGIDVVFAHRLIRDLESTCQYAGDDSRTALNCILEGSGLSAEQVRRRQWVIIDLRDRTSDDSLEGRRATLSGFIVDGQSGEVLPGAHVYFPDLRLGAVSNLAGYFAVPSLPVGTYRVRFSYIGYQRLEIPVPTDTSGTVIRLYPQTLEADGVVVEDQYGRTRDRLSIPSMVPVPARQLTRLPSFLGEKDLFQALQWIPGVQKPGEIGGELVIRGGEPDQNLYLLDGVPVYHPWHTFNLFSTFQTETLRDVNLYKGSFPAEYGGRLSSVMDAQMRDGNRSDIRGVSALSLVSGRTMVEGPVNDKLSFMVAGRRSYLDFLFGRRRPIRSTDGTSDTLRIGYYFYDFNSKVTYRPSTSHSISVSAYSGFDNLDVRVPFQSLLNPDEQAVTGGLALETGHRWGNQVHNIRHQYLVSPRMFLTTTLYRSRYRAFEGTFIQPTVRSSVESKYNVRIRDYGLRMDVDYYRGLHQQIRGGIHVIDHHFTSDLDARVQFSPTTADTLVQASRVSALETVAYLQSTWTPGSAWQIQSGIRGSYFSSGNFLHVSPRLFTRYSISRNLAAKAGVSTQVQYMHRLRDRYSFVYDLSSSRWIPSDDSVEPASGYQAAVGLQAGMTAWLNLTADLYWRRFRNVLLPEDQYRSKDGLEGPGIEIGALLSQYLPGYGRAYGAELTAEIDYGSWTGWAGYTLSRVFNRGPLAMRETYHPTRFDAPHNFQGAVEYRSGAWTASVGAEVRSGFPFTVPTARYMVGDPIDDDIPFLHRPEIHNGRLPMYLRLDASIGYNFRFLSLDWQAQLQVFNFTNNRNVVARHYNPKMERVRPVDRLGLPILPVIEFEVNW